MTAAKYLIAASERSEELQKLVRGRHSKSVKEAALRELRGLEAELGLDSTYPNGYNKP